MYVKVHYELAVVTKAQMHKQLAAAGAVRHLMLDQSVHVKLSLKYKVGN